MHESGSYRLSASIQSSDAGKKMDYIALTPMREDLPPHLYITENRTVYQFVQRLLS
ncbi:hypothetical protein [Alkalicoccus luteus]|uniref:hypothetical protein n=1 Tax=Alkalicoccus luteus TaxID=1237094 RepID=UPI00403462EF